MRIRITLILVSLLAIGSVQGQHKFRGTVVDNAGSALPGVNVLLLSTKDSSLVKGGVSDVKGRFDLENIATGTYLLNISFVGFKTKASRLDVNDNLDMGVVQMENETTQLDEVAVKAVKPFYEQKMDRIVVNVQNTITAAGGTALDVLERSPGVRLNRGTNDLSLNGKNGIVVMINGKPTRQSLSTVMQLLGGMNASNIEKIELITNPPAQYEAAGNGGIINIQIAKSTDLGTNGSVSLSAGYGQREKAGASLNFNHRANKANLYGDFSYSRDHRYAIWTNDRTAIGELETVRVRSNIHREPINTILNGRIGLDYQLTEKTLIGGFVTGFSNIWDMTALTDGSTVRSAAPASFVTVDLLERGRLKHLMGNFNLNQKLGQKTEMNFDLDYLYYQDKNETRYQNDFFNETGGEAYGELRKSNKLTPKKIWVASLGFTSKLGDRFQLEYGLRGIRSRLDNDVMVSDLMDGVFVIADPFTELSDLSENIGAAYTSANYTIDDKTTVKAGLRYENSETDLDLEDKENVLDLKISQFFPTLFLSRKLAKETTMQLSYGRRITRPSFGELAPFFIFLDPTTYFYGNTSLRPAISNNFRAGVTYKQSVFAFEHTYEKDAIEGYQPLLVEGTDQQVYTSLNLDYRTTTSLMVSTPVRVTEWWNMNLNLMGVRNQLVTPENTTISLSYYNVNLSQNFILPSDFTVELSGFYQSASLIGISRMGGFQSVNLGVQKKFKNESKLKLAFNNIFGFNFDYYTASNDKTFTNLSTFRFERRIFNLSYSYNFGNQKLKTKRNRTTGSDEIKNRLN